MTHPLAEFLRPQYPSPDSRLNIEFHADVPWGAPKTKSDPLIGLHPNPALIHVAERFPLSRPFNEQEAP